MKFKRIQVFPFYAVLILVFDFYIRSLGLSSDFENYELAMKLDYNEIYNDFYYMKEPGLWYFQKFLYEAIHSPILSWIIIDIFTISICIYALVRKRCSPSYLLIYFLSFYSILGMFNTYRQFIAMALVGWLSVVVNVRKIIFFAMTFHWISVVALFFTRITRTELVVGSIFLLASLLMLNNHGLEVSELMNDRAAVDSGRYVAFPYTILILYMLRNFYIWTKNKMLLLGAVLLLLYFLLGSISQYERVLLSLFQLVIPYAIANDLHKRKFVKIFCFFSLGINIIHPAIHSLTGLG